MHNQQGQIFNFQSNQDWKELQKLNRRKEESFQSDMQDIFSTSQLKSPQFVDKMNYLQVKNIEICSPRIDFFDPKNLQEDSIAERYNNKEQNIDELSATRNPDQSKNLFFSIPQKNSQQNISQLISYKNNESATLAQTKGQNIGVKSLQNIANNNINVIMNLKKKVSNFIQQYTVFGKTNLLNKNPIVRKMINDKSDGSLKSNQTPYILYLGVRNILKTQHSHFLQNTFIQYKTSSTILEMFFTSIAMIFIITIFGYMVNMIGIILEEMNKLNENKLRDINIINKYMKRKHITKDLKARVNLDLEYLYLRSMKQKSDDEYNVLSKISPELQNEIKIEYNKNIVSKIKCLMNNFSESTINQVCLELQEEFYSPNQILFNEEEIGDSSLIFLVSGQIDLFQNIKFLRQNEEDLKSSQVVKQIDNKIEKQSKFIYSHRKGSVFGELNFFTGMGRTLTAKSKQFSTVLKLRRDSFLNIIKNNQQDFEKFCEIKDKILMYSDFSPLEQSCQICQSTNHFESQCVQAHFNKKNPFLFAKFNYSVIQERYYQFKRKRIQKINTALNLQKLQEKAEQIQQNYELSSLKNPENCTDQPSIQDEDDDEEEDDDTYDKSSPQNDEIQNSKLSNLIIQEKELEYPQSPEHQITYAVSKFSLLNGFTIEDKTRKTSQSNYRNEIQPQSPKEPRDSLLKNAFQDESLSINVTTQYNNQTNTPRAQSRGVTQYQSSGERTEFTAFMKEMNQQDSIREQDHIQKELMKKSRNQKFFQENMRRYSVKTDYSKKKIKNNTNLRRSTYFENDFFKANDVNRKQSLINNHEITYYERLVTQSLWNLEGIKVYSNYFPSGNYISVITKFNQQRKKYLKQAQLSLQDKQKSATKKK
ncbi:hypothetical protein ABPG74_010925 [Tetrahymena malaccensis]